jgi:hypothetical protein
LGADKASLLKLFDLKWVDGSFIQSHTPEGNARRRYSEDWLERARGTHLAAPYRLGIRSLGFGGLISCGMFVANDPESGFEGHVGALVSPNSLKSSFLLVYHF